MSTAGPAARYVAVVGPGAGASDADIATAHEVGRLLGGAGVTVLTGGLGGVMAGATAGAASQNAVTVALLPGTSRAGSPATVALATGLGELRNALLVRAADAVIAVGGSWGTLSEIALAQRTGVPVICLGGWDIRDEGGEPTGVLHASTAQEAVDRALALA